MTTIKIVKTTEEAWKLSNELRASNYVLVSNAYWAQIWENQTTGEIVQIEREAMCTLEAI